MAQTPTRGKVFSACRFFARLLEVRAPAPTLHFGVFLPLAYFGASMEDALRLVEDLGENLITRE
jgi:hypothetical protein